MYDKSQWRRINLSFASMANGRVMTNKCVVNKKNSFLSLWWAQSAWNQPNHIPSKFYIDSKCCMDYSSALTICTTELNPSTLGWEVVKHKWRWQNKWTRKSCSYIRVVCVRVYDYRQTNSNTTVDCGLLCYKIQIDYSVETIKVPTIISGTSAMDVLSLS